MASSPSSLVFKVERREHELIVPAKPTPYEIKYLSDLDNQAVFRFQVPCLFIYKNVVGIKRRDPAKIIREAIAKALIYYYPFAGRVREGANHKLMVECTGEGVLFIEADAHVRLDEFGDVLKPPFPCMQDLLYNVPGSDGIIDCPLLLIQVTRLICGGFILGLRLNHTMSDASGLVQFMTAVTEMAHGVDVPSIQPIWKRELLHAREPPTNVSSDPLHPPNSEGILAQEEPVLVQSSFVFSQKEIQVLKGYLPPHLRQCSRFEILTAIMWRCYTICLNVNPTHQIRMMCLVNARSIYNPPLPVGYYGNTTGASIARTTAGKLCHSGLGYVVELVKKAKSDVTDEFMRSTQDILVKTNKYYPMMEQTYVVSDITRVKFTDIDFGWGKAAYGGPIQPIAFGRSSFVSLKNQKGEDEVVVTMNLPRNAMERFVQELDRLIKKPTSSNSSSPLSHL